METWKKNLWILWVGSFIVSSSFSMVIPFLPLFLIQIGVNDHIELWSGILFSSAFLAGAIASPFWGAVGDKYGRKPMIIRAGLALCVIYLLTAFVTSPYQLLVLRLLQGLLSGFIPGSIALVGTNTPEKKVGYALSMISTATATGSIMGPMLGGVLSKIFDNRIAFGSAGVLCFIATMLIIFWVKEESFVPSKDSGSIVHTFSLAAHNRPFMIVLVLTLCTQFSVMTIEPVLPLYIVELGISAKDASLAAGFVFSLVGVAGILFAPRWGKLADRIGFHKILLIGLLAGGIGTLLQIPFHNIWWFSIIRFMYGIFFCAVFPALNGLVVRTTESEFRGRAFSLNQTASQLGGMLGPLVGGAISGVFSIHAVFWVTGILLLGTMSLGYWSQRHAKQQPATVSRGM
ncbi:MFS transporter [Paenibacillus sp. MER TA 81-3]|uniref:MFS transporter n=1 Tax=Paenibacillus sp. MER TA 81-3 TaxID=2939573 RepID=UPI00203D5F15|nr:MFS transporter [Paenibacillus sp. MER TA 81-3]MCM3341231.1 MFS transporter [Paenibacillus sp. MER TA 81-3]